MIMKLDDEARDEMINEIEKEISKKIIHLYLKEMKFSESSNIFETNEQVFRLATLTCLNIFLNIFCGNCETFGVPVLEIFDELDIRVLEILDELDIRDDIEKRKKLFESENSKED